MYVYLLLILTSTIFGFTPASPQDLPFFVASFNGPGLLQRRPRRRLAPCPAVAPTHGGAGEMGVKPWKPW